MFFLVTMGNSAPASQLTQEAIKECVINDVEEGSLPQAEFIFDQETMGLGEGFWSDSKDKETMKHGQANSNFNQHSRELNRWRLLLTATDFPIAGFWVLMDA